MSDVKGHSGPSHPYHLVNPSPWPLLAAAGAFVTTFGAVHWWSGGGKEILYAGFAIVLLMALLWWRDVIKEAQVEKVHSGPVRTGLRMGMGLFISSEVMFFVAWFWIFFEMALFHNVRTHSPIDDVRTAWATWPPKGIETVPAFELPLVNTLTLLLSGTTVTWAHHALQTDDRRGAKIGLALTIALGLLFTSVQAYEYHHILTEHLFYSPEASNAGLYGSSFFMATGFHGFHVIIGTIVLTVCLIRLLNGGFTPKQHFGFEAAAWYWHFVDVVWLFLFTFLYVIFGAGWGH